MSQSTSEQIGELIADLSDQLERLRVLYEQYFIGIEKREPTIIRTKVERGIRELSRTYIRNTALRFRFNTLKQKLQVYRIHWGRTMRQIEAGTWRRQRRRDAQDIANVPAAVKMARKRRHRRLANLAKMRGEPIPEYNELGDFGEDVSFGSGEDVSFGSGEDVSFGSGEDVSFGSGEDQSRHAGEDVSFDSADNIPAEDVSFDSFDPNPDRASADEELDRDALPALPLVGGDEDGGVNDALDDAFARLTVAGTGGNGAAGKAPQVAAEQPAQAAKSPSPPPGAPVSPPAAPASPPAAAAARPRVKRPTTVPPPVPRAPALPSPPPKPPRRFEGVYAEYIKARKANGESTAVPYEKLERILKQQENALRSNKKWNEVTFRVAEENGKAVVKAARAKPSEVKPKA